MRIVKIVAGLGNQLFCYAFYRHTKKLYGDCYVDLGWFDFENRFAWYPYQLELLGLHVDELKRNEYIVKDFFVEKNNITEEEFESMCKNLEIPIVKLVKESHAYACDKLWEIDDAYYMGCFQNIDNFRDVIKDIQSEIVFPNNDDENYINIKRNIIKTNSVSVHVRLSDYDMEDFEQVCPLKYYYNAIKYMKDNIENPTFYVFSNKITEVKERFGNYKDFVYVDINDRYHGIGDMELMSLCKNNIIPNSTFGWWGAVLNKNPDKIVIAPDKFNMKLKNIKDEDINLWFDEWVKIKIEG